MRARDVIVVGAGPAGCVTALLLARAGFDVALLERHDVPRSKACGDCISPGANALLQRLGVWQDIVSSGAARLTGWMLRSHAGASFDSRFATENEDRNTELAFAIERARLDALLFAAARAAGAEAHTRALVTSLVRSSDGTVTVSGTHDDQSFSLRARLVVGADGLRSRIARLLRAHARKPRVRKLSLTAHVRDVPDISLLGEMHLAEHACLGIAPVQAGTNPLCNVTTVIHAEQLARARGNPHELMRMLLRRFPHRDLSNLITDDVEILASGPFDWPTREIAWDGAALVGDAAGYYDPFTGQGIFQALTGAELLAQHAARALSRRVVTKSSLRAYAEAHQRLVRGPRRVQHVIEYVCARPALADRVFNALQHAPHAANRLVAVTGDIRPARDLLSPRTVASLVRAVALYPAA